MNRWLKRLLLVASIGGGFTGAIIASMQERRTLFDYSVDGVFILAFLYGIWAGLKLVEDEREGVIRLFWFYVIQIPIVISPIVSYRFGCGAEVSAIISNHGFSWRADPNGVRLCGL